MPAEVCKHATDARWRAYCRVLLVVLLAVRWVYAAIVPLDLVPDEAYYWDWSRQPDWAYFSKPPMIAWLNWLATAIGGSHVLALRSVPVLLSIIGLWGVFELGARLFDGRTGFLAVVLCAASPGSAAGALLMTIDAPFLCAWIWALYFWWILLGERSRHPGIVVACITSVGLGLLSKQTMLAFPALCALFIVARRSGWSLLRRYSVRIALAGPLLFLIPSLIWNMRHNWVTAAHTAGHFGIGDGAPLKRLLVSLEFIGAECLLVSPITWWLVLCVTIAGVAGFRRMSVPELFLWCFGPVPLLGVTVLSLLQRVQPNWPAAAWPAAILLAVAIVTQPSRLSWPVFRSTVMLQRAVVCGVTCAVLTCAFPFVSSTLGANGSSIDTLHRLRGWKQLADEVAAHLPQIPESDDPLIICITSRRAVSELAFYLPHQPRVYRWTGGIIDCQHGVWGGPQVGRERDAIIVMEGPFAPPSVFTAAFASVSELDTVRIPLGGNRERVYRLFHGRRLRDWPEFSPVERQRLQMAMLGGDR